MKNNWKEVKLGDVCKDIYSGGTPKSTESLYYTGNIPWLRTQEINFNNIYDTKIKITEAGLKCSSAKWIPKNTVVIAMYGNSAGRSAIAKIPMTTNQACCNFVIDETIANFYFIYNVLKFNYQNLKNLANGGAQQNLNSDILKKFRFKIPSEISEQKRIADILSSFDDKIELLQKQNKTLEDMAKAIFKSWFVDFDIVKAKQRKEKKSKILNEYKITEEIYNLFPDSFEDSELGKIPKGWEVKKIETICDIFTGKKDVNQTVTNGKYVFFSCSPKTFLSNDFLYDGEAIIIAGNGSYTGRVSFYNGKFDLYQRTYACVSKKEKTMPLIYMFMKYGFESKYMGGTRGSSIPYIVKGDISDFLICYSNSVANVFCKIINNFMTKQQQNDKQIQTLTKIRDTLLPKLISGEIRV